LSIATTGYLSWLSEWKYPEARSLNAAGGIQIIDFSPELGQEGIIIHLNGVTSPPYAELFPHHVETYKKQFQ
jgi:hypothetical protein